MRSESFLKIMIACMAVTLALLGLTTQVFSPRRRKFVNSKVMFIYSVTVILTFSLIYTNQIWNDFVTNQFDLKNASKLHSYINIIAAIISYLTALMLTNALVSIVNRARVFETVAYLDVSRANVQLGDLVVVVKIFFFPLAIEATLMLRQLRNEPERHLLWTVYNIFPSIIANVLPNCFFGTLVICRVLVGALNARLLQIVSEVNCMQTDLQMQLQKPYYRMQRFCELADQMDVLAEKYALICAQCSEYLELLAVPFVCSLLCNLFGITAGFFTQYLVIADALINQESYDVFNTLTNSIFLIIPLVEIALQATVCNENLMAIKETGLILQRMSLVHADVRFKQSAEAFSLQIFVTNYKIQPLGLLEVNVSLLHDVLSAVTSFLLILIQTDLTLRFSLK